MVILLLHLVIITDVSSQILDEKHYVPEANALLEGEDLTDAKYNPEHPPLGKLLIAGGIECFGDKPVGWRIFPILFGTASIILFYLICQKLTSRRWLPLIATFLFAFENMCFVMSSVAMLDVFSVTLMLASFLLYLHYKYLPASIAVALSALAKLSGAFAGGIILLHWLLVRRKPKLDGVKFLFAAPAAFFALMPLFDRLAMSKWLAPWDRFDEMINTAETLTFASVDHPAEARPWDWLFSPEPMWFWYSPTYQATPNWTLWALVIPGMCLALYGLIRRSSLSTFSLSWFIGTYLIWIPVVLVTDRVMFKFYFYPAIGAVCLVLGLAIHQILKASLRIENRPLRWSVRIPAIAFLLGHLAVFIILSPYCGWPEASY
ncbi:MAG: phospholipid carrier-dependent glycosyltransferase [Dehalococcoidia bacterium]